MKRTIITLLAVMGLWMPFGSGDTGAQTVSNSSYTAVPPFVNNNATPNVLILLDNSGSMGRRAQCEFSTGSDGNACPIFNETVTYGGLFDTMTCYTYDAADASGARFETPTAKATISTACAATQWDGNFLNWATLRRIDMAKVALIGGTCATARNADGTCPPIGSPSKITIKAASQFAFSSGGTMITPDVPTGAGVNRANGRVPTAVQTLGASPANLRFHVMGTDGGGPFTLIGSFCVDNDGTKPADNQATCDRNGTAADVDSFTEQQFRIKVTVDTEPTGVIQEVGSQVRFGLMKFLGVSYFSDGIANEGGQVEVPVGAKQRIAWNGSAVTPYSNNMVAMVAALDASYNQGNTPMAETLYEAARYFAQIPSALHPTTYVYPNSFSAIGLAASGPGSLGPGEEKVLTGSEDCNLPVALGYTPNVCGRDPYFFGSNHTPMWASPSTQAPCCQSFVIIFTDGDSQQDGNVPGTINDLAHAYHNSTHCTGTDGTLGAPVNIICNIHPATPTVTLMQEHKTDFANSGTHYLDDVAYWMHTRDLRQAVIPEIASVGHDLLGKQNVTVYAFFAFAQMANKEFLLNTAKQGGFDDIDGDNVPDCDTLVLTNPCEWDSVINATGAQGRDNIPDTYFESSDVAEMKTKLAQALASILQKSTSGTSVSVLAASSSGEGAIFQAYFFPKITEGLASVYWLGYTQALFLDAFGNLREDSVPSDGRLRYAQDKIVKMRTEVGTVKVDKYRDADADGKADDLSGNGKLCDGFTDCDGDGILPPADSDDVTDAITGEQGLALSSIVPLWEAGRKLAERDPTTRRIWTWVDLNAPPNGLVDESGTIDDSAGEVIAFSTANAATLAPYLRAGAAPYTAANIINFIRGADGVPMLLRNRQTQVPAGSGIFKTWKFGDPINSTPTVVAAPRERYDVIYGDASYTDYFVRWRDRRQVAYVGANDGMLHAINVGFLHRGDDPATSGAGEVEHGWFTDTLAGTTATTLGDELWGFIPQELLPQLQFLADPQYRHVYYVDLKPKVTDVRIFTDDGPAGTHPGGWGTILIGGMRLGGSCKNCLAGGGGKELQINDFNGDGDTIDLGDNRVFRSSYFVLDITDPDNPRLLFTFTDADLGLTTSFPAVVRVNPTLDGKTSNTNAKWFMLVGSGPTEYNVGSYQPATLFVVNLALGPSSLRKYVPDQLCLLAPTYTGCSFLGDISAVDVDLDYRTDAVYMGSVIDNDTGPAWKGKLHRLTMGAVAPFGGQTDAALWGASFSGQRRPTSLLVDFTCPAPSCTPAGIKAVGPVVAPPVISQDDQTKIWVFWGTGRYFSTPDKTNADTQFFIGVKDPVPMGNCTQSSETDCEQDDLVDVSNAVICLTGCTDQVSGVTGVSAGLNTFNGSSSTTLEGLVASKEGWFTTMPAPRERVLTTATLIGGIVFFPSFAPENDLCSSSGDAQLYALFYKTGTAYKESVIGTSASGNVKRSGAQGTGGALSQMAMHVGGQGSGGAGNASSGGCSSGVTGFSQSSSGSLTQVCSKPALSSWSRYISWMNERT